MEESDFIIRAMKAEDYAKMHELWLSIRGFGIRSVDDSREGIERFIHRNPTTSVVAEAGEQIIGTILCGHDGRRGCFYHVCVAAEYRKSGVGRKMVELALQELAREHISKVSLIAFHNNREGNGFWQGLGWKFRDDLNYYEYTINTENEITFNK